MKHSKVTHFPSSHPPLMRKKVCFDDNSDHDDTEKLNYARQRCCRMPGWCSKFLPCLVLSLLVCGTVVGIVLALQLSPILNNKTATTFPADQTSSTTAGGNTTVTVSSNVTSISSISSASSTPVSLITPTVISTSLSSASSSSSTPSTLITPTVTSTSISSTSSASSTPITSTVTSTSLSSTSSASSTPITSTVTSTSMPSITSTTTTMATFCANWTWNATGITVAGTGSSGSSLNQLNNPWNIYLDLQTDILYIADSQNHRILKWLPNASSGIIIAGTGSSGSLSNQLNTPKDVFVDSSGNIYVADTNNQRIQFFPNSSTTGLTISTTWGVGSLYGVFAFNNSVYACDYTNGAVWNNGTAVAGNQGSGSNSNQLNYPQGFTIDTLYNKSTMYIANSQQHTIVQWLPGASTGNIVAGTNGAAGNLNTALNYPVAIKVDSFANLFIVDNNNHRIQLYCRYPTISSNGRTIAGISGVSGTSPTYLTYPAGLALDSSLNLYVSDTSNHRIQKFMRLS